jgi:hypothetical protein
MLKIVLILCAENVAHALLRAASTFVSTPVPAFHPRNRASAARYNPPLLQHNLPHTIALLTRTPAALDALLRGLPETWTHRNEGQDTWSVFDILSHLVHAERIDWMPRVRMILEFGETKTFDPFDRQGPADRTIQEFLDIFARLRSESLRDLQALNLSPEDLERRGRHPAFGTVTLSQLLATWAAHDVNHLHQISRVMAHQYREAVGPWSAYLGVLR